MAIIFNDNIRVNAGKPVDAKYLNTGNTSYSTCAEVNAAIVVPERHIGMTVNIGGDEYWYRDGVTDSDLVPKLTAAGSGTITGATNIGFFSGDSGVQTLEIWTNSGLPVANHTEYRGFYESILGHYYRDENGFIRVGVSEVDSVPKRIYVKEEPPVKTLIWSDLDDGVNQRGWFLMDGDASLRIGDEIILGVDGVDYYGSTGSYDNVTWVSSPLPSQGDRTAFITGVMGDFSTGPVETFGGPVYSRTILNGTTLELRTIRSLTPTRLNVDFDDAFVNLGVEQVIGENVGTGVGNVYLGVDENTLRFRRLRGAGDTVITQSGDDIVISSIADGQGIAFADNGLTLDGNTVVLGGTLTGSTTITGFDYSRSLSITGIQLLRFESSDLVIENSANFSPARYDADYFSGIGVVTERSIPDVGFVTGITSDLQEQIDNIEITGATGTGTTLTIEDEGDEVLSGVTHINFIGVDVKAQDASGSGVKRVNVYIPPPEYASNFNTTNGTTNANVGNVSTTPRYVALPDSEGNPYNVGVNGWETGGPPAKPTIRNSFSNITYSTPQEFSIYEEDTTTFEVVVFDADGDTPLRTHQITITGNTSQTSNDITINITDFDVDADRFKARVQVIIAIADILPEGGRFTVRLTHDNIEDEYVKNQVDIFRDSEPFNAEFGVGAELTVLPEDPVIKQLSGVYFYTNGSQWRVDLDEINNLNSRSYPTSQQVIIESNNFAINETLNINGETGVQPYSFNTGTWTRQHDTTNAEFTKIDWTTNVNQQTNWNHGNGTNGTIFSTNANARIFDWEERTPIDSIDYNYLIDTLLDNSGRSTEMFRTETHSTYPRLKSDLTPWDNTVSLAVEDGGNGLQLLANRLVYPQYDFTIYLPESGSQPNYSTLTGNKTYYRRFETDGFDVSNGIIQLVNTSANPHNITEADLDNYDVIFEISIDDGVSWFILNDEYPGGSIEDGDGCRIDVLDNALNINNRLGFTFGELKFSDNIILKITFTDSVKNKYISGINILGDNWG